MRWPGGARADRNRPSPEGVSLLMTHLRVAAAVVLYGMVSACGILNPTPPDLPGNERAPWVLDAVSGAQLDLRVIHGCSRLAGVDAVESEDRVEVRAWIGPTGDEGCFPALLFEPGRVVLDAPLGTRALVGCMIEQSTPPFDARDDCGEIVVEE